MYNAILGPEALIGLHAWGTKPLLTAVLAHPAHPRGSTALARDHL